uniref:Uncharacterized protein n=1 Tax=Arundo donax TaxID=35708 RepID=A0A0A9CZI9_ARUDO
MNISGAMLHAFMDLVVICKFSVSSKQYATKELRTESIVPLQKKAGLPQFRRCSLLNIIFLRWSVKFKMNRNVDVLDNCKV